MVRIYPGLRLAALLLLGTLALIWAAGRQNQAVVLADVLERVPAEAAATTHQINYQGRLVDPVTGAPKANGDYSMTFRIYTAATGGTILWTEIKDVMVSRGLFATLLGDTTALDPNVFDGNDRWLGVKVGSDAETSPRMRLAFVPYASYALNAGTLGGQNSAFYQNATNINAGTLADARVARTLTRDSEVMTIVTGADGAGSGLDADLLDGQDSSAFVSAFGGTMSSNTANPVLKVTQEGTSPSHGVAGLFTSQESYGVQGETTAGGIGIAGVRGTAGLPGVTLANKSGVLGQSDTGWGVTGSSLDRNGIFGWSTNHWAIEGQAPSTGDGGVLGTSFGGAAGTSGVYGLHTASNGIVYGVRGETSSTSGYGVYGNATASSRTTYGVYGESNSSVGRGVIGRSAYLGVYGYSTGASNSYGVYGYANSGGSGNYAGYFAGNVHVSGTLSKSSGTFKIDHPLDPENKYLSHSFVESPDMMNVYNGNATLGEDGSAWVDLPSYFQALNRDFRYQLTAIGGPGPNLHIAQEIQNNRFQIAGGGPGLRVSWQVTGIRQDAYANANRVVVEQEKPENERGTYLHPEVFGQDRSRGVDFRLNGPPLTDPTARPRDGESPLPVAPAIVKP